MKKQISNTTANLITIGGVSAMLLIAGLPLTPSIGILGFTALGCKYLTDKRNHK